MGRLGQIFVAPGPEEDSLPIPPSAWHDGRLVLLPMEHWDIILDFAETLNAEQTQTLRDWSYTTILPSPEELKAMLAFIAELQQAILKAPPLVPEATELFPENFPNEEHVRMLESVAAVFAEAGRLQQPFEGDVDT